jgi:formylglycine-generating enzyme required for sulfatase activity
MVFEGATTASADLWVNPNDRSELIRIPAGEFIMGSERGEEDERPRHRVHLDEYWIGKLPVTNAQYRRFLKATGYCKPSYWDDSRLNKLDQPVVGVSWHDAVAYCKWAGLSLPTEAQWEKAARGTDERKYPWGSQSPSRAHCSYAQLTEPTTKVGSYPGGASPYGCMDMAGNVWEWCQSLYNDYPYRADDGREDLAADGHRVVRGGSWFYDADPCYSASRDHSIPVLRSYFIGFRVSRPSP